jgi:hypothetical protein
LRIALFHFFFYDAKPVLGPQADHQLHQLVIVNARS